MNKKQFGQGINVMSRATEPTVVAHKKTGNQKAPIAQWLSVIFLVYLLIVAVGMIEVTVLED